MEIVIYIVAGAIAVYLLLIIFAGVCLLIAEKRFKSAPDRNVIEAIINEYKLNIQSWDQDKVMELTRQEKREVVERDGVQYSVAIGARPQQQARNYLVFVSVGRLRRFTFGHTEDFVVNFDTPENSQ